MFWSMTQETSYRATDDVLGIRQTCRVLYFVCDMDFASAESMELGVLQALVLLDRCTVFTDLFSLCSCACIQCDAPLAYGSGISET